jgi:hypothetical protein
MGTDEFCEFVHGAEIGDVADGGLALSAACGNTPGDGVKFGLTASADDDAGLPGCEFTRDCRANTAISAGYDGDFPAEIG